MVTLLEEFSSEIMLGYTALIKTKVTNPILNESCFCCCRPDSAMSDIDDHTYSANNDQKIYYEEVGGESILHEQHDQDMSGGYDHQQQQHHHLMQQQQEQLHMQQQQQQHHMQQQQHHMQQLQGSSFNKQFYDVLFTVYFNVLFTSG